MPEVSSQIIDWDSEVRCYKCGSPQIASICHHCSRPICSPDTPEILDAAGINPISTELMGLGLSNTKGGESPIHCENCDHVIKPEGFWDRLINWIVEKFTDKQFAVDDTKPTLPLVPDFSPIQVRETLHSRISMDAYSYNARSSQAEGTFELRANLGKPEQDQIQAYREKFHLNESDEIEYCIGFAVLRGPTQISFSNVVGKTEAGEKVIALTGKVGDQAFLKGSSIDRNARDWIIVENYEIPNLPEPEALPVRLVPSLVQRSYQKSLDLEVQWPSSTSNKLKLSLERINLLELRAPTSWGRVERAANALIGTEGLYSTITWTNIVPNGEDQSSCRHLFSIDFERTIDRSTTLRGKLEMLFRGSVSNLESVALFYPQGGQRRMAGTPIETRMVVDFELSLAGLRYQSMRIVPDQSNKQDVNKKHSIAFEGVIPDHKTVIALTNSVSNSGQGFYIKRVIENPPHTGEQLNSITRNWDIGGRFYDGVYPIDFRLIVSGEEINRGDFRNHSGMTEISCNVQGEYANSEMQAQIENLWDQLQYIITSAIETLAPVAPNNGVPNQNQNRESRIDVLLRRNEELLELLIEKSISEDMFHRLRSENDKELQRLKYQPD